MIVSGGQALDIAPQALAETTPVLSNGYFYADSGLTLSNKFATYAALYRAQPSVATVVDKVSISGARLSFRVWDITPATGKVEDTSSPFAKLMSRPTESMSSFNFWRWTFSTHEIYGEAFWLKQRDDAGNVISLLPMHPSRTSVKRDENGETRYLFTIGGVASAGLLNVPASEVVPFLRYNPDGLMRGMSRLEPLRTTLLNEDAARRATESWWLRGARPSVALKHPGELSEGAQNRLRANWEARHAGADLMGGTAILEEGMEAQIIQLTADEMQYIESRKLNLQEVCMVYDVPPPVVHILDHATYSNITEQMRSMYRDTMSPRLEDFESVIDHHLRADFFGPGQRAASFSLDEVLRGDFETRATAVGNLIEKGVMKPSEGRPLFDLPDAGDVANQLYGNAALVPLGSSVHGQTEVNPAGDLVPSVAPMGAPKPIDPAASAPKALDRALLGILGRLKSHEDLRAALLEHHVKELTAVFDEQRRQAADGGPDSFGHGWDTPLAATLHMLGLTTAKALGSRVARRFGGSYDPAILSDWLRQDAVESAKNINGATVAALKTQAAEPDVSTPDAVTKVFDILAANRIAAIARSRVASVGGLSTLSAAGQHGARRKTWVTGPNPRPEHAALDGETVAIEDNFSNGAPWPGADDEPGCNCSLDFD